MTVFACQRDRTLLKFACSFTSRNMYLKIEAACEGFADTDHTPFSDTTCDTDMTFVIFKEAGL